MISVDEARQKVIEAARLSKSEKIPLRDAVGRVLAEDVKADRHYPPFNRAAMDGFAFRSKDFLEKGIREFFLVGTLFAGQYQVPEILSGQCIRIMTGAATPPDLDCIVQMEMAEELKGTITFSHPDIKPWLNIARMGEDCRSGDIIFRENTIISPVNIGILASLGKNPVEVRRTLKVAILSTGSELVHAGEVVSPFQIRDSNAYALEAFFNSICVPVAYRAIVKDNPEELKNAVENVMDCDVVVLSGGVSMGSADFVPAALGSLGVQKIFHKIKLKPGKPLWFGKKEDGPAFFGLPGNPLSCQVCFKLFIEPYVRACQGVKQGDPVQIPLLKERKKKVNLDEYFPVTKTLEGLEQVFFNGSGDITSTLGSTGIARHPFGTSDINAGDPVEYISW